MAGYSPALCQVAPKICQYPFYTRVKPRFNEVTGDRPNSFITSRVCYIEVLFHIFYYYQPRSQGLSSSRPQREKRDSLSSLARGGKMRDPGNEVVLLLGQRILFVILRFLLNRGSLN